MNIKLLNSKFEYFLDDSKTIVNVKDTSIKHLMISALHDGSDGISNVKCKVTGEKLMLIATEILQEKYNPNYINDEDYTIEEKKLEDNFSLTDQIKKLLKYG